MSNPILKYQSAFPCKDDGLPYDGMTYRQWAAVHITAAFIVGENSWDDKALAKNVLRLVDALIEELERTQEEKPEGPGQFTRIER